MANIKKNQFMAIKKAEMTIVAQYSFDIKTACKSSFTFPMKNKTKKKKKNDQIVL